MLASVASFHRDLQNFLISGPTSSLYIFLLAFLILVDLFRVAAEQWHAHLSQQNGDHCVVYSKSAFSATALPALPAGHTWQHHYHGFYLQQCTFVVPRDWGASYRIYCGMRSIYRPVTSGGNFIVTKFTSLSDLTASLKENSNDVLL